MFHLGCYSSSKPSAFCFYSFGDFVKADFVALATTPQYTNDCSYITNISAHKRNTDKIDDRNLLNCWEWLAKVIDAFPKSLHSL